MANSTDPDLDELVRRIEHQVANDPESMRRISDRAFELGAELTLHGEAAAVRMLVADGVPEEFARTVVRDIVVAVVR